MNAEDFLSAEDFLDKDAPSAEQFLSAEDFLGSAPKPASRAAPQEMPLPEDPTYGEAPKLPGGVKPSDVRGGRGNVNPMPALVRRADSPYADAREALDDAVDQIESGADPQKVFASFEKIGVTRDQILGRGKELGGKAFGPAVDQGKGTTRTSEPVGEMKSFEPTAMESAENFLGRVGARGSQAVTGIMATTGMIGPAETAKLLAADQKRLEAAAPGEEIQRELEALGKVKSYGEIPGALVKNWRGASMMLAESLMLSIPALAGYAARLPVKGAASIVGLTSGGIEYGAALSEALADRGASLLDVGKVETLLKDEAFLADVRARGAKRGLPIGLIDGLTAGVAGKFIEPALATVRAGKMSGAAAQRAAAQAWAKELAVQTAGGAGGEVAAQKLTGENKPLDVVMEAGAGLVTAPVEAMSNAAQFREARPENQLARALEQDVEGKFFVKDAIDGYARAALTPDTVLTNPNIVSPEMTRRPVFKAEDMPSDHVLTPEELEPLAAAGEAERAAKAALDAGTAEDQQVNGVAPDATAEQGDPSPAAPATGATPPTTQSGLPVIERGSLAARSKQRLQENASAAAGLDGEPVAQAAGAGQPASPVDAGGVGNAGRAAGQAEGQVAAAPDAAGATGGTVQDGVQRNAQGVANLQKEMGRRRAAMMRSASSLEAAGLGDQASTIRMRAERIPQVNAPQPGPALDSFTNISAALEKLTGRSVVAYSDARQASADGFFDDETGALAVNVGAAEMPVMFTVFHEFTHYVQGQAKKGDAAAQRAVDMMDVIWASISVEGKRTYAEKYLFKAGGGATYQQVLSDPKKLDLLKNEMLADFMGKRGIDKRFMSKLAKREPQKFGEFVKQWVDMLSKLIDDLKGIVTQKDDQLLMPDGQRSIKDIDQFIAKLTKAKEIAEEVMVEWANANPQLAKKAGVSGEVMLSARSKENELGAFNPFMNDEDKDYNPSFKDDEDKPAAVEAEERPMKKEEFADFDIDKANRLLDKAGQSGQTPEGVDVRELSATEQAELYDELEMAGIFVSRPKQERMEKPPEAVDFSEVKPAQIRAAGLMAEAAFPQIGYSRVGNDMVGRLKMGGKEVEVSFVPAEERRAGALSSFSYPKGTVNRMAGVESTGVAATNFDSGTKHLSTPQTKKLIQAFTASGELFQRKFDLKTAVTGDQAEAVLSAWRQIAKLKGAFEFGQGPEKLRGKTEEEVVQGVAESMLAGTKYSAFAFKADKFPMGPGSVKLMIMDTSKEGAAPSVAYIEEVRSEGQRHFVMHTEELAKGSSIGKVFYQIAFEYASKRGDIPVVADGILLGVNNYRRTEQMMSSAARSGRTDAVRPGIGQRIYGWREKPRGEAGQDDNMLRLALAQARNVAEFIPGVENLNYDPASDSFSWPDGSDAEAFVTGSLSSIDVRLVSISRSTIARAAITFSAMDGRLDLSGVEEIASPVLYSAKQTPLTRHSKRGGRIRRTIPEMVDAAMSMEDWRGWYDMHVATIEEMFGADADLFRKMLAATSQAATVATNVALALKAYRQHYAGEPFTGYLPAVIKNLERVRAETVLAGPKISEYGKANDGDPDGIAVDRHIAQLMFNTNTPNLTQVRAAHRRIREIAELLGWEPRQVQSALWAYNQVRKGKNPAEVQSYDAILKRRAAEVQELREFAETSAAIVSGPRAAAGAAGRGGGRLPATDRARTRDERSVGYEEVVNAAALPIADDVWFSGKQATLDAISKLPKGLSVIWDGAGKKFDVKNKQGNSLATGKTVVATVDNYLKLGLPQEKPKQFKSMDDAGAQESMDDFVHAAMATAAEEVKAEGLPATIANTSNLTESDKASIISLTKKGWLVYNDLGFFTAHKYTDAGMHEALGDNVYQLVTSSMNPTFYAGVKAPPSVKAASAAATKPYFADLPKPSGIGSNKDANAALKKAGLSVQWNTDAKMWFVYKPGQPGVVGRGKTLVDAALSALASPMQAAETPAAPDSGTLDAVKQANPMFKPELIEKYKPTGKSTGPSSLNELLGFKDGQEFLVAPDTPEFKEWFGNSVVKDWKGRPKPMFHGTGQTYYQFKTKQANAFFLSPKASFASSFAGMSASWMKSHGMADKVNPKIMSLWVRAENPWDYENKSHIDAVMDALGQLNFYDVKTSMLAGTYGKMVNSLWEVKNYIENGNWPVIESSVVQDIIRYQLGHDAFYVTEGGAKNLAVYDKDQIKLAMLNVGAFGQREITAAEAGLFGLTKEEANALQAEGDMRFSVRVGPHSLPEFGTAQKLIATHQDRYNRWKQAVDSVREQGGIISEDNEFYLAEERYWGKTGAKLEDFQAEVEAWIKEVEKDKLDLGTVAEYAYAEHAADRNAMIAQRRASMPDGGSGMTNQEAADILDDARQSGLEPLLQKHSQKLRDWTQGTRDLLYTEGLISDDEYASWTLNMPSYVPLRGLPPDTDMPGTQGRGTGQGFNIRGKESKEAKGRRSRAKQIIEHIISDRTKAHIRAGKNEVLKHFLKFVLDNPSPNLWEVNAVETTPISKVDINGDRVIDEVQRVVSDNRVVTVKDGGEEIHIVVRDEVLRNQLQNLDAQQLPTAVGAMLFVNRILSRLYTSLSPVFTVVNGVRDVQTAVFGAIDEMGFLGAGRLLANMPRSFVESMAGEFGSMSPDYAQYRNSGGKTGFFDFKTVDDLSNDLMKLAKDAELSAFDPRKAGPKLLKLIEAINGGIENTARLAAFKTARQRGMTVAEASRISKNLTVNFNRKGTATPLMSSWFLFYNPAVQGTTRMLKALKSPKVISTLGAAMAGVFALGMRNASMGEDDDGIPWWDKIPNEVKERNLIVVLPPGSSGGEMIPETRTGRYVKIPMPYGYNVFAVIANSVLDVWRNSLDPRHGKESWKALTDVFGAFMGSWIPVAEIGGSFENEKSAALVFTPDSLNPIVQNILNVNPFGRALSPEGRYNDAMPDSTKFFAGQSGTFFQKAAEGMNAMAGGSAFEPPPGPLALFDMTPGAIENLVRGYLGGPATFAMDIMNSVYARQSLDREELDVRRLPFAKQLYGVIDDETDRMMSYSRMDRVDEKVTRLKAARDAGDDGEVDRLEKKYGAIAMLGGELTRAREQLSKLRKEELAIIGDEEATDAQKLSRMLELNKNRRSVLQGFNASYNEALLWQRELQSKAP